MSLGKGYEYLLGSVARGDGAVATSSPLTRYYAESGTPPGRFLGAGLAGLNDGDGIAAGTEVSEEMLFHLLGMMADPVTGEPLGRRPRSWPHPPPGPRAADVPGWSTRVARPVSGFDLTFSVPKSVSTVWALADATTQAAIYQAHRDAIDIAIGYAEKEVFFTRIGRNGAIQEEIRGVVATAFDHWDSRAGDPHLHTHIVVANRAQTADGTWRTIDSRTLHRYVVALSELHEGVLQDLLSDRLGYGFDERRRRHSPVPRWEIAGVPDDLIAAFSSRSTDIEAATNVLIADFAAGHGRQPSDREKLRLRQQATLATRPDKRQHTLAEQTATWRNRAREFGTDDPAEWTSRLRNQPVLPQLRYAPPDEAMLRGVARIALDTVGSKRATFTHANVLAEVHRQLHGTRFASPDERLSVAEHTSSLALSGALALTPLQLAPLPEVLLRADGTSKLRPRGADRYTTQELMDAETRLLEAGRDMTAPTVPEPRINFRNGTDQTAAIGAIVTSGRVLDVLVGPAGSGKTRALAAVRRVWEHDYGTGTVLGLAPSASAAQVLADELGIATENTAKWLHETAKQDQRLRRLEAVIQEYETSTTSPSTALAQRLLRQIGEIQQDFETWSIRPGQLVIVDEASLAGTLALDKIVTQAAHAGGKVLLVGDPGQLSAIDAGGAFSMLVHDRPDAPELSEIHRFEHDWERTASRQLRVGDPDAIAPYRQHDRILSGGRATMLDQLFLAWRDDTARGLDSIMIAADRDSVTELNQRAQADRIDAGDVDVDVDVDVAACVPIADGAVARVGDRVVTRHNDRRLRTEDGWVKNGDTWTVQSLADDGSLIVREGNQHDVVLPADYVTEHVELGYATTTFRAQGRTVDTAHALIGDRTTREALYVSATRGRQNNTIYVDIDAEVDHDTAHGITTPRTADEMLLRVLGTTGADTSAHAALEHERRIAEHTAAQHQRPVQRDPFEISTTSTWIAPRPTGIELGR